MNAAPSPAQTGKKGLIEEAAGSTLFLDEIGDIGSAIQAKLLRVLETSSFRRLGGNKTLSSDARIVTATNRDIETMSRAGTFRSDLYFRLSRFVITIPPLRERREDIEPLARHFLALLTRNAPATMSAEALKILLAYDWPGNVRELRNAIERAVILARPGNPVRVEHLSFIPRNQAGEVVLRFGQTQIWSRLNANTFVKSWPSMAEIG
jgi:transcriptional regulator with PAS, ATPase and Fis domain